MGIRSWLKRLFKKSSIDEEEKNRKLQSKERDPIIRTTVGKYIAPNTDVHEMHRGEHWHGEG